MKEKVEELNKLYKNLSSITPDKLDNLITQSIQTFEKIVSKIQSGSEEEKKEAVQFAEQLRDSLEGQANQALSNLKMNPEEIEKFTESMENFSENEWDTLSRAKKDIKEYQEELIKKGVIKEKDLQPVENRKKKKTRPIWVAG